MDIDLDYLRTQLERASFTPFPWDGEDKNLGAFRSKEELIAWYCQPPGKDGEPYRDRGFYCRELAFLSRVVKPRTIVEFGTSLGIGTCLLHWLNPDAKLITVDITMTTYMPGDREVEMGILAKHQKIPCQFYTMESWAWHTCFQSDDFGLFGADLCFIDADHSYESVVKDSETAWNNRSNSCWAICWHDHNERHPGVMRAVKEFCDEVKMPLQSRADSDTVWIMGDK